MYEPAPNMGDLAAFGLTLDDFEDDPDTLPWPEHLMVLAVFKAMSTQWLRAPNGQPTGLNYGALPAVLDMMSVREKDRHQLFADLRVMEHEALDTITENLKQ